MSSQAYDWFWFLELLCMTPNRGYTKKFGDDSLFSFYRVRDDEGKMIEKIASDVSNEVNFMEANEACELLMQKETKELEKFEESIKVKLNGVRIPSWYMYAFSLIYLCLLTLRSRLLL